MYYSVCAPALFGGMPLDEAIRKIALTPAKAYEFWSWGKNDIEKVFAAQEETGLVCAAMCGSFEPLNIAQKHDAYIQGTKEALKIARRLKIKTMITQVGAERKDTSRDEQHAIIVDGLKKCAPLFEDAGVTMTVEPLNTLKDHPGYFLSSSKEAFDMVDEVNSPNVKVLFDIYHQQVTEGNVLHNLLGNLDKVGHIHIAGNPGRGVPFENSELNYQYVVGKLLDAGYNGAVGLEYFIKEDAVQNINKCFELMPKL